MNYCYRFPVVKGIQAGREYYIGMVPLKMLGKLFPEDTDCVLPEYRAQRRLNESRIPEITKYILNNEDSYVFSALAASIDGKYNFIESNQENVGVLEVSLDARFLMNDGQHRKAAIVVALEEDESIGDETISVVFYGDKGLKRSQQMFTDLNKHAVKTSNSIAELYDSRDEVAVTTRNVISRIPFLDEYVDKERDIIGKFSSALFTLNTFYTANKKILRRNNCDQKFETFIFEFWNSVVTYMEPWNEMVRKELAKKELRELYVATQAIIIQAFGRVGACLWEMNVQDMDEYLSKLRSINWKRSDSEWKRRVMRADGRIINNESAIMYATNYIKKSIGIELTDDELAMEEKLLF